MDSRLILRHFVALAALLACSTPALAQEEGDEAQASAPSDVIEVVSQRGRERIVNSYVRELGTSSPDDPLPLYAADEYCPAVVGMTERANAAIAARMRVVAEAAGIGPAEAECTPSALVFLVEDKEAFIAEFRRTRPLYFQDQRGRPWSPPAEEGPATAWHLTQMVNNDGMPVSENEDGVRIVSTSVGGSRINSMIREAIAMAVVVIERDALRGLSITQVADYALMRSLTSGRPADLAGSGAPTILTVLDTAMGAEADGSVTEWDLAYLQARYEGDPRRYGSSRNAQIRSAVEEASLDRGPAPRER